MKILVLNCGSSSVKFKLLEMYQEKELARGRIEEIGHASKIHYKTFENKEINSSLEIKTYEAAIHLVLDTLMDREHGVIKQKSEITGIGHRVVHGGIEFKESILITDEVLDGIKAVTPLSPLHNPANLDGIYACQNLFPDTLQVAVFDTAYGSQLPESAFVYAIPRHWREKYHIRRYGFHGTSHSFVAKQAAALLNMPFEELRIISCHLGSGASVCATQNGRCAEISMGFTPLEGLIMSTRCGDLDPAILPFIGKHEGLSLNEIDNILNKESGLQALYGTTDFRIVEQNAKQGEFNAIRTLDIYVHRIKKYIGAYMCIMGGMDVLVFTAGIGEHSPYIRERIVSNMQEFGVVLDKHENENNKVFIGQGRIKILVIPTNEELAIARDTKTILENRRSTNEDDKINSQNGLL